MVLKPQPIVNRKINTIIGLLVFIGTLAVYMATQARSLSFWDAGEFITCGSILGVPHPPGNPFYIILGRFFAIFAGKIPHATVLNFLSALFSAFAVMFTYLFTVKFATMFEKRPVLIYLAGILAAFYTAFSYTFWTNSIEAEVYSGLAFILNLVVWLTMIWVEKSEDFSHQHLLVLIVYIFFLGFGIHQTSLQLAPAVLFIAIYPMLKTGIKSSGFWVRFVAYTIGLTIIYQIFNGIGKQNQIPDLAKFMFAITAFILLYIHLKGKIDKKTWILSFFFILIGFSTHIFLLIRSEFRPFINEGHPHNMKLFTDYILRRQYGVTSFLKRRASFGYQLDFHFFRYFGWQFFHGPTISKWLSTPAHVIKAFGNTIVLLLGVGGAYYQLRKNKHSFAYYFAFFFLGSLAMVFVMNLSDKEVRDRDYFFVTAYNYWTVWMAFGSIALISLAKKLNKYLGIGLAVILVALPTVNLISQYHIHDRSKELVALDYGMNILNSLEEDAIIFTNGDNDTFPLWYAQACYDPHATENIYPKTDVTPTKKTKALVKKAMDFKNSECFGARRDVTIANLSLLNTPWYIRQLRDREGVEFRWTDEQIDALRPMQLGRDMKIRTISPDGKDTLRVSFKKEKVLYNNQLAVIHIIQNNFGKRPIYFAVTCSDRVGFDRYLRNEGMVERVTTDALRSKLNVERMINNLDNVYQFRGIFDDDVYKDENMLRLINNYGAAFLKLSQHFESASNHEKALHYAKMASDFVQDKVRFTPLISDIYLKMGETGKAIEMLNKALSENPYDSELYLRAGLLLLEYNVVDEGYQFLEKAITLNPNDNTMINYVYQISMRTRTYEKGAMLLEKINEVRSNPLAEKFAKELRTKI